MNKDKQIEEMAKLIKESCQKTPCYRDEKPYTDCDVCEATYLYNAGYRKASEFAREIFEEIEEIFNKRIAFYTDMAKQSKFTEKHYAETMIKNCEIYIQEIAELKKKYTEGQING